MKGPQNIAKPSKQEQKTAMKSYSALAEAIKQLKSEEPEIEIEESKEHIKIQIKASKLLSDILEAMSKGQHISIVTMTDEITTHKATEYLDCDGTSLVRLLL